MINICCLFQVKQMNSWSKEIKSPSQANKIIKSKIWNQQVKLKIKSSSQRNEIIKSKNEIKSSKWNHQVKKNETNSSKWNHLAAILKCYYCASSTNYSNEYLFS